MNNGLELLSGGSFHSGSLSGGHGFLGGSGGSLLAAASSGLGGFLLGVYGVGFVVVNELDDAHLCIVTLAETGLQNAEVSARTVGNLLGNLAVQFRDSVLVVQVSENGTTGVSGVVLALGYQRFDELAKFFCLGQGR